MKLSSTSTTKYGKFIINEHCTCQESCNLIEITYSFLRGKVWFKSSIPQLSNYKLLLLLLLLLLFKKRPIEDLLRQKKNHPSKGLSCSIGGGNSGKSHHS